MTLRLANGMRDDVYQHYRNAVIRMRHLRGAGIRSESVVKLDAAIERATLAERESRWRDAAQVWITAAYSWAEDEEGPEVMEELLSRGQACLDKAEAEEPFEPMGEGI